MFEKKINKFGEEHGMLGTLPNSDHESNFKNLKPKIKEQCKSQREEDAKVVKARYLHRKDQTNGQLHKCYCAWGGQEMQQWRFLSGEEYEVPKGLVNEVNDKIHRETRLSGVLDANEKPIPSDMPGELIHEFLPCGF